MATTQTIRAAYLEILTRHGVNSVVALEYKAQFPDNKGFQNWATSVDEFFGCLGDFYEALGEHLVMELLALVEEKSRAAVQFFIKTGIATDERITSLKSMPAVVEKIQRICEDREAVLRRIRLMLGT